MPGDPEPPSAKRDEPRDGPESAARRSLRRNAGACLEPLEPIYQLSTDWSQLRRRLNVQEDALAVLAIAPAFRRPYALSVHRRPGGGYFLRVTRVTSGESASSAREGAIDNRTARLVLDLWRALISRVQMVETDEFSFDGTTYYFSAGTVTGYAANPRNDGVLDRSIFALTWLGKLVEEPSHEDPADREFIRDELQAALVKTRASEPCVRVLPE